MAEPETRYVRPPAGLVEELVTVALTAAGAVPDPAAVRVETRSSTLVALHGDVAVRVAREPAASAGLRRAQRLVDALPALPFAVPRSLGDAVELDGIAAVPVQRIRGAPHPAGSGDAAVLRALLEAVHAVPLQPLRGLLAEPHAYSGGVRWLDVLESDVLPRLDAAARPEAARRVASARALPVVPPVLGHGDLAGGNVLWAGGRVAGVLDWDLAAPDDPAEDVASLASWHGWDLLPGLADPATAGRAAVLRATFPLQVVAFGVLRGRAPDELARAVARAERALRG